VDVTTHDAALAGDVLEDSATGAAAAITATLAAAAGTRTRISGFSVTGSGATGASRVVVTVTGLTDTLSFVMTIPAGVTLAVVELKCHFDPPLPASADNTAIVVNVPSFGAGNTNAAVAAWGPRY